ncbi:MAG TPA: Uma2 family endonuclease [Blastocatellia bacterium]|nr:Uma2 family endonuclease [Blastocatellia bacterium]
MSAIPEHRYSLEEYLKLDLAAETRYEYFNGEIVDMAGGSLSHNLISSNLVQSLGRRLAEGPCTVLTADMHLKVPLAPPYRYADVSVVCGEIQTEQIGDVELLINPLLIVEVLSPATAAYDRGAKFTAYCSIPSFREYLLIAQDAPYVTQYVRQADGQWVRRDFEGLDSALTLPSLDCTLTLAEIYRRVSFQ